MAEIKVERKSKAPIWPWIIGILVLLGLIWFLIDAFEEDNEGEYEENEVEETGGASLHTPHENTTTVYLQDFSYA